MADRKDQRTIVNIHRAPHRVYDMDGPAQPEMSWLPLSCDRDGNGCYVMRMQPGAETLVHEHEGVEDYLILEGDIVESDGTVLGPGDFVSYRPGTTHNSRTKTGCLLIAFEWGKPRRP
jgi:anti-sigma factor ChrR (cupin superfamily)